MECTIETKTDIMQQNITFFIIMRKDKFVDNLRDSFIIKAVQTQGAAVRYHR